MAVFYLASGLACLALARGELAFSPWAMGLPFGAGQLLAAAVLYWTWSAAMSQPEDPGRRVRDRPGRFAYDGLERVYPREGPAGDHDLAGHPPRGAALPDLKELCALTDGNLSRHLQVLHEAGFVEVWKGYQQNRPQTLCRLTDEGRRRFLEYITVLENVVADALAAAKADGRDQSRPGRRLVARLNSDRRAALARRSPIASHRRTD